MTVLSRLLSGFFLLAALLLTLASLSADWLFEACSPVDQFGRRISLFEAQRKSEELSDEVRSAEERMDAKETATEALLSGKMSLFEAASCFRSLHADPRSWHHPHSLRPLYDDGEAWCREAIDWAETKVRIEQSIGQAKALRKRLEAELREHREYHGTVILPE
jgi:hypothetical protein